ncbi:MAG: hypothetical protein GY750_12360 [Lentisphaerae bacterium]|nr:hypothetical protein [Lentisphaerota bacterium]
MDYYVSYAVEKDRRRDNLRPGRRGIFVGHAQLFLTRHDSQGWELENTYGLYGRRETSCGIIYGFISGSSMAGHHKDLTL